MPRDLKKFEEIRLPPQNVDAEMSVLGSLLIDQEAIFRIADTLHPSDFYKPAHRLIFQAMADLTEKRHPIDIVSVNGRLKERGELETVGGVGYLASLANGVPTAANVHHYAHIVQRKRIHRDLINAASVISEIAYDEKRDAEELLDEAEQKIFSISQNALQQKFLHIKDLLAEWQIPDHSKGLRGITTGFADLNEKLSGLQKSDLVVLAARPSLGKTALALDVARNAALLGNVAVGIFSLEMSRDQIMDRLIAAEAEIELWKLRTGHLSDEHKKEAGKAKEILAQAPMFINDVASPTIMQIRAMARRLQAEHKNLGLLVIDYLQLVKGPDHAESRVQEVSEISRSLKALAKELNVPVLAISQLSRAVEMRQDAFPKLSDLRESGSIEQDADVVMFIYRPDKAKRDTELKNVAEIHIAKHRNGPTGVVKLRFDEEKTRFYSLDETHDDGPF